MAARTTSRRSRHSAAPATRPLPPPHRYRPTSRSLDGSIPGAGHPPPGLRRPTESWSERKGGWGESAIASPPSRCPAWQPSQGLSGGSGEVPSGARALLEVDRGVGWLTFPLTGAIRALTGRDAAEEKAREDTRLPARHPPFPFVIWAPGSPS